MVTNPKEKGRKEILYLDELSRISEEMQVKLLEKLRRGRRSSQKGKGSEKWKILWRRAQE